MTISSVQPTSTPAYTGVQTPNPHKTQPKQEPQDKVELSSKARQAIGDPDHDGD